MNLSQTQIISIAVNSAIFLILVLLSIILVNKIKLENKGYKYLFWLYTLFWMPIMLVRPYRGTMQNAIDPQLTTFIIALYGLVGIFIRIFADVISFLFKYRKAFLYFSVVAELILFIPILITPNTATNIVSTIGIGIGASCIGTYELLFKEQYGNKKAFLTVSVLSVPPLLANFITAPVQSIMKTIATTNNKIDPQILKYMWIISAVLLVITFIMLVFYKEKRMQVGLSNQQKAVNLHHDKKYDYIMFIFLAIIGSLIAFIKFSNSDALATQHLQNLSTLNYGSQIPVASYEGYISVIFSLFQLVAGILMGLVLIRRINVISIFCIGSSVWVVYLISSSFISNPAWYFVIHSLNGFGYGILYNLVLALVLKISLDNKIITKMGIYQSILSIGIMCSGWFTGWIKESVIPSVGTTPTISLAQYMHHYLIQNVVLMAVVVVMTITFVFLIKGVNSKTKDFTLNIKQDELKVQNKVAN